MAQEAAATDPIVRDHPRTIGWLGTTALAMGGSNQSLFLIAALFGGQGEIPGQGSASVALLIVGLLLSYAAAPGWIELILMTPNRVGGIAAACSEAFRRYSQILSALTGVCYWWGWIPTCGLTALFSATAINQWILHEVPVPLIACALVAIFTIINLLGIAWVTRVSIPIATVSAGLAFVSMVAPVVAGEADWGQLANMELTVPFPGWFGALTSMMAGLYLIGFAAPAFEAATCHVGETKDPVKNVPRAVYASGFMAAVYFLGLPVVWFCVLGAQPLTGDLGTVLGPTFAPLFGATAKSAAIWFMMFNMFHGTMQPLAGAARTMSQLADDGLLPRFFSLRSRRDVPYMATLITGGLAIVFLLMGDPIWLVAAANYTYLIGICMPNIAVWLLRRDAPDAPRPWRAPRGTIGLGVAAAAVWFVSTLLGFQQFGLPTVVFGLAMAYSGAGLFAWRKIEDRVRAGLPAIASTLHLKLTGSMLLVLVLDAAGYIAAVSVLPPERQALSTALEDIFVAVAMLTITVGIVLPGMIAHSAEQVSVAAQHLSRGILRQFTDALDSLGRGNLEGAKLRADIVHVAVNSKDELGQMAESFNRMQDEVAASATGLDRAREGLRGARDQLTTANATLREKIAELERMSSELLRAKDAAEAGNRSKAEFLAVISHELRTPLNGVIGMAGLLLDGKLDEQSRRYAETLREAGDHLLQLINDVLDFTKLDADRMQFEQIGFDLDTVIQSALDLFAPRAHAKGLDLGAFVAPDIPRRLQGDPGRLRQVLINLLGNAVKFTERGAIAVEAKLLRSTPEGMTLQFEVRDTGIGIDARSLPLLFREFSQIDSSISRRFGGSGLGLAISRKLVAGMGGEISADSVPGQGSTFRFTVQVQEGTPDATAPAEPPQRLDGLHVLVVDDSEANRSIFARQIESRGGTVVTLGDPRDAEAMLREAAASGRGFDAVLLDHAMPHMDGETLARRLRDSEAARGVPLILATSSNRAAELRGSVEPMFDAVLTKPAPVETLARALRAKASTRRLLGQPAKRAPAPLPPQRPMRILIAEDNATNQIVIRAFVEKLGHKAEVVANGLEALEAAATRSYDLVLMDVMMPEMDGIAATRRIRALPGAAGRIPILALTAAAGEDEHNAARDAGMQMVMTKPVTLAALAAAIAKVDGLVAGE